MDWFTILQWVVGLLFFANKVFLLANMKAGWKIGLVGILLATIYFFVLNLYILMLLEVALGLLFLYGLLVSLSSKRSNKARKLAVVASLATMPLVAWSTYTGEMTILETIASVCMLLGFYYIAGNSKEKMQYLNITNTQFGWIVLAISHIVAAWLMRVYFSGQEFFADMQIASVIVCLAMIIKDSNNFKSRQM